MIATRATAGGPRLRGLPGVVASLCLAATPAPAVLAGQVGPLRGYSLSLANGNGSSALVSSGGGVFQRLRLMAEPRAGPLGLDVAYEHGLQVRDGTPLLSTPLAVPTATTWMPLQWTLVDDDHVTWTHRFDRLAVTSGGDAWELSVGRQAVSWATTLFLTPADPFAPFDPSDPFREYRAGVDAARLRVYPGTFSELDVVVRPADTRSGTTVTALVRAQTVLEEAAVSAWGGIIHDEVGGALGASRSVGSFELRGETALRSGEDGDVALRLATGLDRRFTLAGRDLYLVLEYQHDDFGASDGEALTEVITSDPFDRGELTVLGQDELALSAAFQIGPLWAADLITLVNLGDGSGLLGPGIAWSAGTDTSIRGGLYAGWGDGTVHVERGVGSEYGAVPTSAYVSLTWFF